MSNRWVWSTPWLGEDAGWCDRNFNTNPKPLTKTQTPKIQHPQVEAGSKAKAQLCDGDITDLGYAILLLVSGISTLASSQSKPRLKTSPGAAKRRAFFLLLKGVSALTPKNVIKSLS